jgi:nicotinamide-nucleotide amidase
MYGELITVGEELLSGLVLNSNGAHIAQHLRLAGFQLRWTTVVGDRQDDIGQALVRAMNRAAFVLVTGGLGPTDDDRTGAAVASALGRSLRRDPLSWDIISSHLKERNIPMTPSIAKMAELPEGANRIDLARPRAGFYIGDTEKPLFFLPGVPNEMADMLQDFVLPTLKERFSGQTAVQTRILRIIGLRESEIGRRLADLDESYTNLRIGYLPHFPENRLTLTVQAETAAIADAILEQVEQTVRNRFGLHVYGLGDDTLETVVGRLLLQNGHTLALAESCTGGLIANLITNFPGCSAFFHCGMVTYSEGAKTSHLQVPPGLIDQYGVVSGQVAEAMVRQLQEQSQASLALALTGLAGPSGGTAEKPVGTVFLALLYHESFRLERLQFKGTRQEIKLVAAYTALDWLRRAIIDESFFDREPHRSQ